MSSNQVGGVDSVLRTVLTRRERDVLQLVMRGHSNREVARVLNLSEQTIKNYVSVLLEKLQVRNRVELVLAAVHQERLLGLE